MTSFIAGIDDREEEDKQTFSSLASQQAAFIGGLDDQAYNEPRSNFEQPSNVRNATLTNDSFTDFMLKSRVKKEEYPDFSFAEKYPETYRNLPKAIQDLPFVPGPITGATLAGASANIVIDTVPGAKYLLTGPREEFLKLPLEQQRAALLMDTAEGELFYAALPALGKLVSWGKQLAAPAAGRLWKWLAGGKKVIKPIEDNIGKLAKQGLEFEGFSFEREAGKRLRAMNFAEDEIEPITAALIGGDLKKLSDFQKVKTWKEQPTSKAFNKFVVNSGEPYGGVKFAGDFGSKMSMPQLLAQYRRKAMNDSFKQLRQDGWKVPPTNISDKNAVMKKQLLKYFDEEDLGEKTLGTINEDTMAQVLVDIMAKPKSIMSTLERGGGRLTLTPLHQTRNIMGAGELLYKTKTNVYDRLVQAGEAANEAKLDYMTTLVGMLQQNNFGEAVVDKAGHLTGFKWAKFVDKKFMDNANEYLLKRDAVYEMLGKVGGDPIKKGQLYARLKRAQSDHGVRLGSDLQAFVSVHDNYMKFLYSDYLKYKPLETLGAAGMNKAGMIELQDFIRMNHSLIDDKFKTGVVVGRDELLRTAQHTLNGYKRFLGKEADGTSKYFSATGKALDKQLNFLAKKLTFEVEGGMFPSFNEGYTTRLIKKGLEKQLNWNSSLADPASFSQQARQLLIPFFAKKRKQLEMGSEQAEDLITRISIRTSAQANDLYRNPEIDAVVDYGKKYLPTGWRAATDDLVNRITNRPGVVDHAMAKVISTLPFTRNWSEQRVVDAARQLNFMQHGGFIGFKPFSVMRNSLQTMLTGMPDGRAAKDVGGFALAYGQSFVPKMRKYLREEAKIITDYLPEMKAQGVLKKFGAVEKINKAYDVGLIPYKLADVQNRMIMGTWAYNQWDDAVRKVGGKVEVNNLNKFYNNLNAGLFEWKRAEISAQLVKGQAEEAKKIFIRDFVANNQFLYNKIDQPSLYNSLGPGVGKNIMAFQSWWMNYGALFEKWIRTGKGVSGKTENMFNWMLGSAMTYTVAEKLWGPKVAAQQSFTGPMPFAVGEKHPLRLPTPPIVDLVEAWANVPIQLGVDYLSPNRRGYEESKKAALEAIKQPWYYTPGGSQTWMTGKEILLNGAEGGLKSIPALQKRDQDRSVPLYYNLLR